MTHHTSDTTDTTDTMSLLQDAIENTTGCEKLIAVVAALRHPEGGCPWDLKQTHQSLRQYLLEESYEALDAIDSGSSAAICEELGDVLLQVALHSQIAKDNGEFDFDTVAEGIAEKLIRRHPHVFADTTVNSAEEVTENWQAIKAREKASEPKAQSILENISKSLPALIRTTEVSKKAVKVGFRWPNDESLWQCVMSEFDEFRAETTAPEQDFSKLEDEMGDIFFATVSLANHYGIDPETALNRATRKFEKRFSQMEALARDSERELESLSFEEWDQLWKQAKHDTHNAQTS